MKKEKNNFFIKGKKIKKKTQKERKEEILDNEKRKEK